MGKHTPVEEQRRLVAAWRVSTLSKAAFARAHRVNKVTFWGWVARYAAEAEPSVLVPFVQVCVEEPASAMPASSAASSFPVRVGPHALQFDAPPPPCWFAAVLRELGSC